MVPVAVANVRPANPHLAGFGIVAGVIDETNVGKHHRPPDRAGLFARILDRHREAVHSNLGETVTLFESNTALLVAIDEKHGQRRAAADEPADVAEIDGGELRSVEQHPPDRRNAEDAGAAFALDRVP